MYTQVKTSVWLKIATKEEAEDMDYSELEDLFSFDGQESSKPAKIGIFTFICTYTISRIIQILAKIVSPQAMWGFFKKSESSFK